MAYLGGKWLRCCCCWAHFGTEEGPAKDLMNSLSALIWNGMEASRLIVAALVELPNPLFIPD